MQKFKCHICGKTISSGRSIEPCPEAPEIKKTVYFCSTRCMNVFVGSVRRNRTKSKIKSIRSELENAEHEPSEKELSLLLGTLTPKEKDLLSAIGTGVMMAPHKTLKEFYQELSEKIGG